jgi:nucleoside-diphosphate-sugar epimerase
MPNVLITGGGGFIGLHLARFYSDSGFDVHLLDSLFKTGTGADPDLEEVCGRSNVSLTVADLTEPLDDLDLPGEFDLVYHLAAINGTELFYERPYFVAQTNVLTTIRLMDWLEHRRVGRLVYTSTSEVYAGAETVSALEIPTDETVPVVFPQPTNVRFSYGISKFLSEFLCNHSPSSAERETTVIRYHNIYGPRMGLRHVIPEFLVRIANREDPFRIFGGRETRAFCYVDDAVAATHGVATSARCAGEIVHVGKSDEEITIEDLARLMIREAGEDFEIMDLGRREASVLRRCPDTTKLLEMTGFSARVPLDDGISLTREWYSALASRMAL